MRFDITRYDEVAKENMRRFFRDFAASSGLGFENCAIDPTMEVFTKIVSKQTVENIVEHWLFANTNVESEVKKNVFYFGNLRVVGYPSGVGVGGYDHHVSLYIPWDFRTYSPPAVGLLGLPMITHKNVVAPQNESIDYFPGNFFSDENLFFQDVKVMMSEGVAGSSGQAYHEVSFQGIKILYS